MKIRLEEHLCAKLYIASRLIVQAYAEELSPLGLTYLKYLVLLALDESNGQTVGELGAILSLDSGTLSPLLKALAHQKYIERKRAPEDERVVANFITPAGRKACKDGQTIALKLFERTQLTESRLIKFRSSVDDFVGRCKRILGQNHQYSTKPIKKNIKKESLCISRQLH